VLAVLFFVAAIGMLVAPASAQAPAPKVTISGFIDNISSWSQNMSQTDVNYSRGQDREWYARTRIRPDITAEVGTSKFVLGIEIDATWGQTGATDTNVCTGTTCAAGPQRFGTTGGWDLNTDTIGQFEVKWGYAEFDLPWLPKGTRTRLGAQPWSTTYKGSTLATGDFAGINLVVPVAPWIRINGAYALAEENVTGASNGFTRGDDYAFVTSVEITPFKGLDIRPIYAYYHAQGTTSGAARSGKGGVANSAAFFPTASAEGRHTIGIDTRWTIGAFYVDPTFFYQFGQREMVGTVGAAAGSLREQDINAYLFDVRGGWTLGPLLLEGAIIYTSGNKATEDVRDSSREINFYQPISTDSGYYGGWAEISALNIDYFNQLFYTAAGLSPGQTISYDKYGLFRIGAKAKYAFTPSFSLRGGVTATWTAEDVVRATSTTTPGAACSVISAAAGMTPGAGAGCGGGDENYLGTEVVVGMTYTIVPNVVFDLVGAYLFAGAAFESGTAGGFSNTDVQDVQTIAARVRYSF
jgi:hypothetical protein